MSISLFPGAVNADLSGYAGSCWKRSINLLGTCCCFILSGGNLESLTEDIGHEEQYAAQAAQNIRSGAESTAQRHIRQNSVFSEDLEPDEPLDTSKVYHRAITSLHAGTDPGASRLNGKVRILGLFPNFPLHTGLPDTLKCLSVSHRLGTRHTSE